LDGRRCGGGQGAENGEEAAGYFDHGEALVVVIGK
jgi:hypothetical protein